MNIKKELNIGIHIIPLPLDKEYKLEELFDSQLTGSYIEKLNSNGNFINKEKILFENNEFIVSDIYKTLKPFDVIRLTLKRIIIINWQIDFKSNSYIRKETLNFSKKYDKKQSLMLMQLCKLIYDNEINIKEKIFLQYKFDNFFYFSEQSHKNFMTNSFIKLLMTYFKSKTSIVDLQFMQLSKYDPETKKEIIVLVFQGSQEIEDWMTNISAEKVKYFDKEKVHKGFYNSLKLFLKTIEHKEFSTNKKYKYHLHKDINFLNDNCKIFLTGHSLGGAIATLAGCYFHDLGIKRENMSIYTFGAPPIGSQDFYIKYKSKLDLYRVVNEDDIIPKIGKITKFKHLGEEIKLVSNENEIHSCNDYIDNLIDDLSP